MSPAYIHATAVALGEKGLLLRGPSGAGKSSLALALIARFEERGDFARLVGDDRISVEAVNGRLIARPHPAIEGLIEIRGAGLVKTTFEPACALDALVDLSPAGRPAPRLPEEVELSAPIEGIVLPRLATDGCSNASVAKIIFFLQRITTF